MFDWEDNHRLTFRFMLTPTVENGEHYVTEQTSFERTTSKFGPMPEDIVKPFMAEREQYWKSILESQTKRMLSRIP